MKKLYLFMASLLAFGSLQAQTFPTGGATPEDAPAYYIQSTRSHGNYAQARDGQSLGLTSDFLSDESCLFKFVNTEGGTADRPTFKIYCVSLNTYVNEADADNQTADVTAATTWYLTKGTTIQANMPQESFVISKENTESSPWNDYGDHVGYWSPTSGDGSFWYIKSVDDIFNDYVSNGEALNTELTTAINRNYAFLRTDAATQQAELQKCLAMPGSTDAEKVAKIKALKDFNEAFNAGAEVSTPNDGLYRLVCTDTSGNRSGNEVMGAGVAHYAFTWQGETASRTIWNITFDTENGTCTLQNNLTKEYLHGATWGGQMTMQTDSHSFKFAAATGSVGKVTFGNDDDHSFIHMQGDGNVVGWAQGDGPSQWYVVPVTADEAESEAVAAAEQTLANAEVNNAVSSVAGMLGVSASSAKLATSLNDYLDGTEAIYGGLYKEADGNIYRIKAVQLGNDNGLRAMAFDKDGDTDDLLFFDLYDAKNLNQLWKLEQSGNGFKLLNLNKGMYAGEINRDAGVKTSLADEGGIFGIRLNNADQKEIRLMNGNKGLNCETGESITKYFVNNWDAGSSGIMNLELVESVGINLNNGGDGKHYATAYLPFAVSGVTGAKAYTAEAPADGKMQLTEASNGVAANTGIVLIGDAAGAATLTIGEGTATESALQGTTVAKTVEANSVLTLGKSGENVGFFTYTGTGLRANSAYLEAATGATELVFSFGDDTDAVESIEAATVKGSKVFDLSGRRVSKAGKGIYIVNGKKVIK